MHVVLGVLGAALLSTGCGRGLPSEPRPGVQGKEVYVFENLDELVAAAPVAVVGRVASTEPGRAVGTGESKWLANIATVKVEQTLLGDVPSIIGMEETGTNGVPYLEEGQQVVLFLLPYTGKLPRDDGIPYFINIGSQGRFLVEQNSITPANDEAGWLNEFKGVSLQTLVAAVETSGSSIPA
jgi:hypothetical protein